MLRRLISFILIVALFSSFPHSSSSASERFPAEKFPYQEMQIQVMPEFDYPEEWPQDKPALLVGYFGTFINKTGADYDGEISFSLPTDDPEFEIYLVAEFPEKNKPEVQLEYKIDTIKKEITWKPTKPIEKDASYKFVVEYYANPIDVKENKSFNYRFITPAEMEQLDIVFYAPINSKDFTMEPKATNESTSQYGEEIHHFQYSKVKADTKLEYISSYIKEDNTSSMSVMNTMTPPDDDNHQGLSTATEQVLKNASSANNPNRPIIDTTGAVIISIAIIILGVFIFIGLKGKQTNTPQKKTEANRVTKVNKKMKKPDAHTEEKKSLRKKLLSGEIDQESYDKEMKKLG